MDSSNAEKAAREYAKYHSGVSPVTTIGEKLQTAFLAGAESRDAEVAELTRLLAESRAANGDSEARTAELEAFREKVFGAARENAFDGEIFYSVAHIDAALAETPSTVLEDRDREVAARAVDGVASMLETGSTNPAGKYGSLNEGSRSHWFSRGLREATDRVRERAAAIRKGDTNV